ncbi:MAG: hypothetical protein ACI4PF_06720 [Christensenellales bacterium]
MKKSDIPFYNDPEDFEGENNLFPCDTQYMVYNPLLHRYFLTPEGLNKYGIDAENLYVSSSPNKIQELIEKTSKKVYDYIQYKSGFRLYEVQMYRIATAPKTIYPSQYAMRNQFEEALAEQARYICEVGDSARYSGINLENGVQQGDIKPQDQYRDISDISKETIRTLETLGLTKWFAIPNKIIIDKNKF